MEVVLFTYDNSDIDNTGNLTYCKVGHGTVGSRTTCAFKWKERKSDLLTSIYRVNEW